MSIVLSGPQTLGEIRVEIPKQSPIGHYSTYFGDPDPSTPPISLSKDPTLF